MLSKIKVRVVVGLPRVLWSGVSAMRNRWFDLRHRTDTCRKFIEADTRVMTGPNAVFGSQYAPVDATKLRAALRALRIRYSDYTLVDLGSGKGKAVMVAANYPFRSVIGIEYSRLLNRVARENLENPQRPFTRADAVHIVHADAVHFPPPEGPLVVLLCDPFCGPVLQEMLRHLRNDIQRSPRPLKMIYINPNEPNLLTEALQDWPEMRLTRRHRGVRIYNLHPLPVRVDQDDDEQVAKPLVEQAEEMAAEEAELVEVAHSTGLEPAVLEPAVLEPEELPVVEPTEPVAPLVTASAASELAEKIPVDAPQANEVEQAEPATTRILIKQPLMARTSGQLLQFPKRQVAEAARVEEPAAMESTETRKPAAQAEHYQSTSAISHQMPLAASAGARAGGSRLSGPGANLQPAKPSMLAGELSVSPRSGLPARDLDAAIREAVGSILDPSQDAPKEAGPSNAPAADPDVEKALRSALFGQPAAEWPGDEQ